MFTNHSVIDPVIEKEFDLHALQPQYAKFKSKWLLERRKTRLRNKHFLDVSCGQHTDMTFDIFPELPDPGPCFIFLHGGFWRSSDKSESSFVANIFLGTGITTVVMNYRLAPAVSIADIVLELRLSVANLFGRSRSFGIDKNHIFIGGFSAGGLLAARVLGTNWAGFGIPQPGVRGGMALSGIFDPKPLVFTSHNDFLGLSVVEADALNVIDNSDDSLARLTLLACGTAETRGFKSQTQRYAKATRQSGHYVREIWIQDRHHYDVKLELSKPDSMLAVATRQMIWNSL